MNFPAVPGSPELLKDTYGIRNETSCLLVLAGQLCQFYESGYMHSACFANTMESECYGYFLRAHVRCVDN